VPGSIADVEYLTIAEAAKRIPGQPHKNTVRRWFDRGFNGVVLQSWRCGNRRMTTVAAIDAFIAATTGQARHDKPVAPSTAHQQAEVILDSMGVK